MDARYLHKYQLEREKTNSITCFEFTYRSHLHESPEILEGEQKILNALYRGWEITELQYVVIDDKGVRVL